MNLIILMIVIISVLIASFFIIKQVEKGNYKTKNDDSILSKEAEEKYLSEFPDYTIDSLKKEIETISDMFVDNEESNRYTESLRSKSKDDEQLSYLRDAILDDVELIRYVNGILKVRVVYKDYDYEYSLVLDMSTVSGGRLFLNNYFIFKNSRKFEEAFQTN